MGKRIVSQARGKGSLTYRVRKQAYSKKIGYPQTGKTGAAEIIAIEHSAAHSAPLLRIKIDGFQFYNPAFNHAFVGQKINIGGEIKDGNIVQLKDVSTGTRIYNIERNPGDGGKMIRTAGSSAVVSKTMENSQVIIIMPNKKQVALDEKCRATVGIIAGDGRKLKPFMTAGRKHHKMKSRNKLWPKTSPIKVNAIDHPFGSGRGKRPKSKIAKRNAPPGRRVGHLRPRRTGYRG